MKLNRYNGDENLREFYITPQWLTLLAERSREWDDALLKEQLSYFKKTLPDYPELHQVFEEELHIRLLNRVNKKARSMNTKAIQNEIQKRDPDDDIVEVLRTELEIRSGKERLSEPLEEGSKND